jgi:hypothetical protein
MTPARPVKKLSRSSSFFSKSASWPLNSACSHDRANVQSRITAPARRASCYFASTRSAFPFTFRLQLLLPAATQKLPSAKVT